MSQKNWLLSSLLSGLLLLAASAVHAQYYLTTNDDGTITISGLSYFGPGMALSIPGTTNGLPVTGIAANAFQGADSSNATVIVEATTNLSNPVWQPVQTNTLTNGALNFSDTNTPNYPGRSYRVVQQ